MGVCNCSVFFVVRNFMSILVCNHLDGEERLVFAWFVLLVSRDCCVALPRGTSLSAVCDCGIS